MYLTIKALTKNEENYIKHRKIKPIKEKEPRRIN